MKHLIPPDKFNDYDSRPETEEHIKTVQGYLNTFADQLKERGRIHDASKLQDPEKQMFDEVTGKLKGLTYGTKEYEASLKFLGPALDHHYKHNSHPPQHYENGVNGMDLLDLVEMFFDWKAATERHDDGNIYKSLEINKDRFKISEQITDIFRNTAINMGFKNPTEQEPEAE